MYVSVLIWYLVNDNLSINFRYILSYKISNNIMTMIDEIKNKDVIQRVNISKDFCWKKVNKITKPRGKLIKKTRGRTHNKC